MIKRIGIIGQLRHNNQVFSQIETAKANKLSPFNYIEYIWGIMPQIDIIQHPEKIDWFMPWSDQTKEEFRIKDDYRLKANIVIIQNYIRSMIA